MASAVRKAIKRAQSARIYNALITETFDLAEKQAENAVKNGLKPFNVVVKDCFAIEGVRMTCASRMLENYQCPYTATTIKKLLANGGCMIGKANMDEFAMGTTSTNSYFGPVKNALSDVEKLETDWLAAGGSSGGCAVAVKLGFADIALGSDTGGSTRNPAAFHGIFGFKPSYGVLSRHGLVALANSFDCPSIFARTAQDCKLYYDMMKGRDVMDSTSMEPGTSDERDLRTLTIGIPREYHNEYLSEDSIRAWRAAAAALKNYGCTLKKVSLPHTAYSIICYHILAESDIASSMARYDGIEFGHRKPSEVDSFNEVISDSRTDSLLYTVRRRIFAGNFYNIKENKGKYFRQAAKVRRLIKEDFDRVFKEQGVDALLTPVTSHSALLNSEIQMDHFRTRQRYDDYFTQPVNMGGLPAISVPFSNCSKGRPIGLQIICDYLNDDLCLRLSDLLYNLK
uniref:Glutamyl-tRNA(Gln) amidotransferase subunit A, mitochondrial n=1 Tax=Acrobeloides nanus TaxID=290746 RepID=A0A914BWF9_9BILA